MNSFAVLKTSFTSKPILLSSLFLPKRPPSAAIAAVLAPAVDSYPAPIAVTKTAPSTKNDAVSRILTRLKETQNVKGSVKILFRSDASFKSLIAGLDCLEAEEIIESLHEDYAETALDLFVLLRNENGFKYSGACQFALAHVLAGKKRRRALRSHLQNMVREQGSGSAPSLCELLESSFRDRDSTNMVWDMLAFAYSRLEMPRDALFVLANMKDLNFRPSVVTYNMYNLRHTDAMSDIYAEMKEAVAFLQDAEDIGPQPCSVPWKRQ